MQPPTWRGDQGRAARRALKLHVEADNLAHVPACELARVRDGDLALDEREDAVLQVVVHARGEPEV